MNTDLEKNGWALAPHNLSQELLTELVKRKDEYLKTSIEEVGRAFNLSISGFDEKQIEYIELAKGIAR